MKILIFLLFLLTISCSNNKVVIAYRDIGSAGRGKAVVGTVSGTSISFGSEVVFEASEISVFTSTTFDSSNNKLVVAYRDADNSGFGTAAVGTISGADISFGTPVVFESANMTSTAITFDSSNNKVVIAYKDQGNSDHGTSIVGTVSGTSVSFGTAVVFEAAHTTHIETIFDSSKEESPNLINPGDIVLFKEISKKQYENYNE